MIIENTSRIKGNGSIVMIVYGKSGVGKTTFAASAPGALLLDFENGSKYLGERGIEADVVRFVGWLTTEDKRALRNNIAKYQTIVVDPLGEAMEKLLDSDALNSRKFRQSDGSLTMAGWGEAKKQMRIFIKWLRDTGKNVIIIAHDAEEKDGDQIVHRIQVATKLKEEIPTIVDVISYLGVRMVEGQPVRLLYTPRQGDQFDSKDRTGRVPLTIQVSEKTGYADFLGALEPIASPIEDPPVVGQPPEDTPGWANLDAPPPEQSPPPQAPPPPVQTQRVAAPQGPNDWARYWERAAAGIVNQQYREALIGRVWEAVERNDANAAKDVEHEIINALQEAV